MSASPVPPTPITTSTEPDPQIPPEGLLARATYPWKARQETDLTFDKDDVITVTQQQDMKWFGQLNGKVTLNIYVSFDYPAASSSLEGVCSSRLA